MDKIITRALMIAMALSFLAFAPGTVRAQSPLLPTQIIIMRCPAPHTMARMQKAAPSKWTARRSMFPRFPGMT